LGDALKCRASKLQQDESDALDFLGNQLTTIKSKRGGS